MKRAIGLLTVTVGLLAGACGGAGAHVAGESSHVQQIQGPHLAQGTVLTVRLDRALDLSSSTDGDRFSGTVVSDARTPHGDILVRAGAQVRGRIAWGSRTGRIYLRDAIVTSDVGPLAMRGSLRLDGADDGAPVEDENGVVRPATAPDPARIAVPLARDRAVSHGAASSTRIPAGTDVGVVLTAPVLAPGATSVLGD